MFLTSPLIEQAFALRMQVRLALSRRNLATELIHFHLVFTQSAQIPLTESIFVQESSQHEREW